MIPVDTKNILFICGGAFVGLDRVIKKRTGTKSMGFGAKVISTAHKKVSDYFALVQSEDLLHFGLIPELMGRLPVIATMDELNEDDLVRILREPKNSLTKQYEKLFELDGIEIEFEEEALKEVAAIAMKKKTGVLILNMGGPEKQEDVRPWLL